MRLSILIPTYNYIPNLLVHALCREIRDSNLKAIEILVWDDASDSIHRDQLQANLGSQPEVTVQLLDKNLGRAKIRNAMAQAALGKNLLFLDSDGLPEDTRFLSRYLEALQQHTVVVGGRTYDSKPPKFSEYLHWKYGTQRESLPAATRNQQPSFGFQSNNFALQKAVFLQNRFPESFDGYGHEDTVFGKQLGHKHTIYHIDNPTQHLGLQTRDVFLSKSLEATEQLARFIHRGELAPTDTRLSAFAARLKKKRLRGIFYHWARLREPQWEKHLLTHKDPILKVLDAYRLLHFIRMQRNH